jgi:hypothetical protein
MLRFLLVPIVSRPDGELSLKTKDLALRSEEQLLITGHAAPISQSPLKVKDRLDSTLDDLTGDERGRDA